MKTTTKIYDLDGKVRFELPADATPAMSDIELLSMALAQGMSAARLNLAHFQLSGMCLTGVGLVGADFTGADLSDTVFTDVNLTGAVFADADMVGATFINVNLAGVDFTNTCLSYAVFSTCNFSKVTFSNARMARTYFNHCGVYDSRFTGVTLTKTLLRDVRIEDCAFYDVAMDAAVLQDVEFLRVDFKHVPMPRALITRSDFCACTLKFVSFSFAVLTDSRLRRTQVDSTTACRDAYYRGVDIDACVGVTNLAKTACPPHGSFIGWKKAGNYIVKLEIPADARRSSAFSSKCRCDKAFVLEIQNMNGDTANVSQVSSHFCLNFIYKVGEMVEEPEFDENRWEECAKGIHFFTDREAAVAYNF